MIKMIFLVFLNILCTCAMCLVSNSSSSYFDSLTSEASKKKNYDQFDFLVVFL